MFIILILCSRYQNDHVTFKVFNDCKPFVIMKLFWYNIKNTSEGIMCVFYQKMSDTIEIDLLSIFF